ncbi:MAG: hypothetical protein ACYS8W_15390 [Planctomycetota bacterium]|jgi:hypothetical protein
MKIGNAAFNASLGFLALTVMVGAVAPPSPSWPATIAAIVAAATLIVYRFAAGMKLSAMPLHLKLAVCLICGFVAARPLIHPAAFSGGFFSIFIPAAAILAGASAFLGIVSSPPPGNGAPFMRLAPALAIASAIALLLLGLLWFRHGVWETLGTAGIFYFSVTALLVFASGLAVTGPLCGRSSMRNILMLFAVIGAVVLFGQGIAGLLFTF